jgi:FKBP-type peptidyl-prolyl cis-trans isomerase
LLRRTALTFCFALAVGAAACGGNNDDPNNPNNPSTPPPQGPPNLVIEDLQVGTGAEATAGKLLNVNYALYTYDPNGNAGRGVLLQSGSLPTFRQGTQAVIAGFDQGVVGMKVGGVRRLTVPPSLAYGASPPAGSGIAPNAWIVFDIQLTNVGD